MMNSSLVTGPWKLKDLEAGRIGMKSNGLTVLSTFSCGGGSTMGYKLAGCEMVGAVEIDKQMAAIYTRNHDPRRLFNMPIQEFNNGLKSGAVDWGKIGIDILDGSPPCSAFSMAGSREDKWGKHTHFREGQAKQVLTDLFFDFIETANIMRPKLVIAENVKGMLAGNAKGYCRKVFEQFKAAGYETQLFLLNASHMGVPQRRERVFFVAREKSFKMRPLRMEFNEPVIFPERAFAGLRKQNGKPLEPSIKGARAWCYRRRTDEIVNWVKETQGLTKYFTKKMVLPRRVAKTQTSTTRHVHWAEDRYLSDLEVMRLQTFPDDYDFMDADPGYVCGMSVPPFMMQRLMGKILEAWPSS